MGAVAAPLAIAALAAYMPDNPGFSRADLSGMEQQIAQATKANGAPLNAGYALNPDGTINQAHAQLLDSLYSLEGDNPAFFKHAGGPTPVNQFLQSLGYGTTRDAAITSPSPTGRGWLGGGYTGASRA
jgi:hypothetical protein